MLHVLIDKIIHFKYLSVCPVSGSNRPALPPPENLGRLSLSLVTTSGSAGGK